jgi:uncharacterized protein YbbC (DUF1343 family)
MIQTGLDVFLSDPPASVTGTRLGLLCHPASVDARLRHARTLIDQRFPGRLKALYSPQHGFFGEKQDNMIESDDQTDPVLNIPVYSLYGKTRIPTSNMLDCIDTLVVDLQDVGTRVYTYIYTLSFCMEQAARCGKQVVVLDRPNPIGGIRVEGNVLEAEYASFVGRFPLPMRHGLTIGELARLFNQGFGIGCELRVIAMNGWRRDMCFQDTGLSWVAPSPNLPTPASATVYPGQVIWEATNVSEGRGTCLPFEQFGAPYLDCDKILDTLGGSRLPGAILRKSVFEPTSNKWAQTLCRGFQIHVTEPGLFLPVQTSLRLLQAILSHHREDFSWKPPPYEYEYHKLPIDLILGSQRIRRRIEALADLADIEASWQGPLEQFDAMRRDYFLY